MYRTRALMVGCLGGVIPIFSSALYSKPTLGPGTVWETAVQFFVLLGSLLVLLLFSIPSPCHMGNSFYQFIFQVYNLQLYPNFISLNSHSYHYNRFLSTHI